VGRITVVAVVCSAQIFTSKEPRSAERLGFLRNVKKNFNYFIVEIIVKNQNK